jgi:3,4-dihydroxy 2-butanone 4-phosphate synthase/GTP cyclohydrolase II
MGLATIDEALRRIQRGEIVILVDDEDRENEGDLCMAAELVTPEAINFMAKFGRGLICLSLTDGRLRHLDIPMMVHNNTSPLGTAFTVSIEARLGVTTGISAADRAHTIEVAVDDSSVAGDLTRPGHIFPLRAVPGGVLVRTGQTEGSVDLARLAGLKPAAVICEVMNDQGEMSRLPELIEFAEHHGLVVVSVEALIRYRLEREGLVAAELTAAMPSELGDGFRIAVYKTRLDDNQHLAIVAGDPRESDGPVLVRVQHQCVSSDVFQSTACNCGALLRESLRMIGEVGCGVVIYLQYTDHSRLDNVLTHVLGRQALKPKDEAEHEERINRPRADLRQFGIGAQILRDLGVTRMKLITSNPKKIIGLAGYGLEIEEQISPFSE